MLLRITLISFLVVFVVLVYAGLVFVSAIKPGKIVSPQTPRTYGYEYERVTLVTGDGLELVGWFIPRSRSSATVMVGHGYPFDKGNILGPTRFLIEHFNCFYFDFRYFGESQGTHTTFGFDERQDVAAAMAHLQSRTDIDPERIGQFGFSLSASTFIQAHHPAVRAMVLDSPFLDLESMARDAYRFLPGPAKLPLIWISKLYERIFLDGRMEDASALKEVAQVFCPVLFIHGEQDTQVPAWHSRKIFEACPSREKSYWLIPGADHGETFSLNQAEYQDRVVGFFKHFLENNRTAVRETKSE